MRPLLSSAAVAFAAVNLYLLFLAGPLVSPQHQLIFHLPGSATALFVPVILDLVFATAVIGALLLWARRYPRAELLLYAALLLPLPWTLVRTVTDFSGTPASPASLWFTSLFAVFTFLCVAFRARRILPGFARLRPALDTLLSFIALSGLVIFTQLLWLGWKTRDLNPLFVSQVDARVAGTPATVQGGSPFVVWIILDELSYRQVYGHRFAGLALPNFDRLASESTVFPQTTAAAEYTRIAVPALLTGLPIRATVPSADGRQILIHQHGERGFRPLQPVDTVFGDAVAAGLPTGVAGWYEPYCRILPAVLDRCFWTYSDNLPGGLSPSASLLENAVRAPVAAIADGLQTMGLRGGGADGARDVQQHERDYRALLAAGDGMLLRQTSGLLLLHMPVPHPWGFYDRRTQRFPGHRTSYLDNLALADAYLGHVRTLLEQGGRWDPADVIVMGDHGWRTGAVWRHSGFWTAEEAAASTGEAPVDAPAVIVKLHGQKTAAIAGSRFDAVRTRALIDALLARRLNTAGDVERWAAQPPGH